MPRYPEHLRHFDYRGGYRYFLTFCTCERQPHFATNGYVDLVREQILRALRGERFVGIAYCFMCDHVHLLIEGACADSDAKRFMTLAKQYSGFRFHQVAGMRLWQRYGYERVLRNDETTVAVARYIIENPVRAGIVRTPEDDPHWGSFVYSRAELLEYIARAA